MRVVGGIWGGRRLEAPPGRETRPTTDRVREAWMNAIDSDLRDARVLDLFAGSGALGIEALSRGARHVTFVETSAKVIDVLRKNLGALDVPAESYRIHRGDAFRFLEGVQLPFDVALADPPYAGGGAARLAGIYAERPFAGLLCLEHATREPLDVPAVRERSYGDTTLTFLRLPDDET